MADDSHAVPLDGDPRSRYTVLGVLGKRSLHESHATYPTIPWHLCLCSGKGAYGTVYQARDLIHDEVVAIKVISLADQPGDEAKQIEKEIDFLASCNHPNIVRYLVGGTGRNTWAGRWVVIGMIISAVPFTWASVCAHVDLTHRTCNSPPSSRPGLIPPPL